MYWVMVIVVAIVVFGMVAVAAGRGDAMAPSYPDRPDLALPGDRPMRAPDVDNMRFSVGLRGYRMDEVDEVLDRLSAELSRRDTHIAELERQLASAALYIRQMQERNAAFRPPVYEPAPPPTDPYRRA